MIPPIELDILKLVATYYTLPRAQITRPWASYITRLPSFWIAKYEPGWP